MINIPQLLGRRDPSMIRSLSNAEESQSLLMVYTEPLFHDLQIEAITGWAARFQERLDGGRGEEDICVSAAEEKSAGACCAGM